MAKVELKTPQGGSVTLVPEDGTDNVQAIVKNVGGTLVLNEEFTQNFGNTGWAKLPNGLIIQWGNLEPVAVSSGFYVNTLITYPVAFPVGAMMISCSPVVENISYASAGPNPHNTNTSFTLTRMNNFSGAAQLISASWVAIGR